MYSNLQASIAEEREGKSLAVNRGVVGYLHPIPHLIGEGWTELVALNVQTVSGWEKTYSE
jgi:hypothetical protein